RVFATVTGQDKYHLTCQPSLQWGRRVFATETWFSPLEDCDVRLLQWGRRVFATETGSILVRSQLAPFASMGPSRVRDAYPSPSATCRALTSLQWGRRVFATETSTWEVATTWGNSLQWGRRVFATETA